MTFRRQAWVSEGVKFILGDVSFEINVLYNSCHIVSYRAIDCEYLTCTVMQCYI